MLTNLIVLGVYFAILFGIGIVASRRIKTMDDYYAGGKSLGYWMVAFSARATGESGWLLIGLTAMGALAGVSAYWVVVGEVLGVAVSWFFMAKPFKRLTDKYDSLTVPDFLESHFRAKGHTLRWVAALCLASFVIIYVSAQIDITGKAFETFLNLNYYTGAIIGFLIVVAYIFIGGFLAVVWSDFFQGLLMFFGLLALPLVAYFAWDNHSELFDRLGAIDPTLLSIWGGTEDPWMQTATMMGFAFIGLGFLGSPQVYARFISVKDTKEIDKGRWVAIVFTLVSDAAAVSIGLLARALFTENGVDPQIALGLNGEDTLMVLLQNTFPAFIIAIYIAIILSAIMSTIDSLLVVASSAIVRDLYQKVFRPNADGAKLARISAYVTLGMALLALGVAMLVAVMVPGRTVFWFTIFGWSGIAATFCPMIILALFWPRFNQKGALACMISGFLAVPFFKFYVQELPEIGIYFEKLDVMGPAFFVSFLVGGIISLSTAKAPAEVRPE